MQRCVIPRETYDQIIGYNSYNRPYLRVWPFTLIYMTDFTEIISTIRSIIKGTKYENHVFAVGGCVRDHIMETDAKDIDLVVDLPNGGIELAKYLQTEKKLMRPPVIFERYGTVQIRLDGHDDVDIELVHTRQETYPDPSSRNPVQDFGTVQDDCMRRDLTINALYFDISRDAILDPTSVGIKDIENHILRTPCDPNKTYFEDPLRMLRCIRFSTKYGWTIDTSTYEGIVKNAYRIGIISKERIHAELVKILSMPNFMDGVSLLYTTGLAKELGFPEIDIDETSPIEFCAYLHDLNTATKEYTHMFNFMQVYYSFALRVKEKDFIELLRTLKFTRDEISYVTTVFKYKKHGEDVVLYHDYNSRVINPVLYYTKDYAYDIIAAGLFATHKKVTPWYQNVRLLNAGVAARQIALQREQGDITFENTPLPIDGHDIKDFIGICDHRMAHAVEAITMDILLHHDAKTLTREDCIAVMEYWKPSFHSTYK